MSLICSRLVGRAFECSLFGGPNWGRCKLQPIGRHSEKFVFQNRISTALCVLDHFSGLMVTKIGEITLHGALLQASNYGRFVRTFLLRDRGSLAATMRPLPGRR